MSKPGLYPKIKQTHYMMKLYDEIKYTHYINKLYDEII